jgi:hypothetical protein
MNPTHQPADDVPVTPADILRGAARYLHLHGWTQGTLYADTASAITPPACALGAIGMAAFGQPVPDLVDERSEWRDFQRAVATFKDYLHLTALELADPCENPPTPLVDRWNDAAGRTAEEVIAALNTAADEWERLHIPPGGESR